MTVMNKQESFSMFRLFLKLQSTITPLTPRVGMSTRKCCPVKGKWWEPVLMS